MKRWKKIARVVFILVVALILLFLSLAIALNIPSVQTWIARKVLSEIRAKTGTSLSIQSVKIAFPNTVQLGEVFAQDKNGDTLVYLKSLKADIGLFKLVRNKLSLNYIELDNAVVNITRKGKLTEFNYTFLLEQFLDSTKNTDSTDVKKNLWVFEPKNITLNNIRFQFLDEKSGISTKVDLDKFEASITRFDLSREIISLNKLMLKNAGVKVAISNPGEVPVNEGNESGVTAQPADLATGPGNSLFFPGWTITAEKLLVENTNVRYDNNSQAKIAIGLDYNHLAISNLNGDLRGISVSGEGISVVANNLNFDEQSGFQLKKLSGEAELRPNFIGVRNLILETTSGKIEGETKIEYTDFQRLADDFGNCNFVVDARNIELNQKDVLIFAPWLAENRYFRAIGPFGVQAVAKFSGKISDLTFENLEFSILQNTRLKAHGRVAGLPDYRKMDFDVVLDQFSSGREDLFKVMDLSKYSSVKFPPAFSMTGKTTGNIQSVQANADLATSYGDISAIAWYHEKGTALQDSFHLDFNVKDLHAGTIAGDSLIGGISASGFASGLGLLHGETSLMAGINVREAVYNSYKYSNIRLDGRFGNKKITASAKSDDPNIKFKFSADADLKEPLKKVALNLELAALNLKELNLGDRNASVRSLITARGEYKDSTTFNASLDCRNTQMIEADKTITVKDFKAEASSSPGNFKAQFKSEIAGGTLSGNVRLNQLSGIFRSAYGKYFGLAGTIPEKPGSYLTFQVDFYQQKDIMQQLVPGLDVLRVKRLDGDYKSSNNELTVNVEVPDALYNKIKIDTLLVTMKGKSDSLYLDLALKKISYDSIESGNITIQEKIKNGTVHSEFKIADSSGNPLYLFANKVELKQNGYKISFLPGGLYLDGVKWSTADDNFLQNKGGQITARNFEFRNGQESLTFFADDVNQKFVFSGFELKNLVNIIKYKGENNLLNGIVGGEIGLQKFGDKRNINADFAISNLAVLDSVAGNFSCKLRTRDDRFDIDATILSQQNKLELQGNVSNLSKEPLLDLKGLVDIQNVGRMQRFTFGQLSQMNGKIAGEVTLKGTQAKPDINGYLNFDKTAFKVNQINFLAKLNSEKISISSKGFHFRDFVIEDAQSKKLVVNGDLLTDYRKDFKYNLHILANDYQPINSTVADNPLFFGKLSLDTEMKLSGSLASPRIEGDIKIKSATNLTYALPGSELKLVTSEGIVKFRDASHLKDSLSLKNEGDYLADSVISKLTGVDLSMNLEIDPDAKFRLDIDPKSGDYLAIQGNAKLNISLDVTGKQSITGVYEVKEGNYQLSFYGMVKKNFEIMPGSTVTWSGRPMDADVNITAQYVVRTSSVALVANETSGMSEAEKNVFKTRLPYEVKLFIRGFPSKPDIKFGLYLPDRYTATYPVVASKVALLNTEERTSELNKQVFALLVTGGFIADNPMAAGEGSSPTSVASTAARNSVNGILADQLNNISGKYINNVDVNFGLTSYDDYGQGSSTTRTELDVQLSKKMFNDRLTLEAQGSFDLSGDKKNTGTSTEKSTGELGVIYQLSKNNEYKLRLYYQNIYDLFEGELTCSGIALIFEKEFDTLKKAKKVKNNTDKAKK